MRRSWALAGAAVFAVMVLSGCGGGDETAVESSVTGAPGAPVTPAESSAERDVRIVKSGVADHETWGEKAYVVQYEITNGGREAANYFAQLEFLDADGDVLGSTGVTADKLGVGKTHKGDIAPLPAEITNGKIADIREVRVSEVDRSAAS